MGFIVGLSGTDGSGKTTVAKLVRERLQTLGFKVTYHHELDFIILKRLFRLSAKLFGSRRTENARQHAHDCVKRGRPVYSDVYYILVWLDNLVAYLYFKLRRGIIVYDRWLYDFLTFFEYKYYKNRLVKWLFTIFPHPDIMILLTIPPEVAHLRKMDDIAHIGRDVQYYEVMQSKALENAQKLHCDSIIDTNRPIDEVVEDVLALIAKSTTISNFYIGGKQA